MIITKPGLYPDIPEAEYHADCVPEGSLSHSGAKHLIEPGCPAVYDWYRRHPKRSREMDTGTVVHGILLGTGQPVEVLEWPNYNKKDAQAARDDAIAAGKVPMLRHKYAECEAIAQAVLDDDECAGLLAEGDRELSGFWIDEESGIWCRLRTDNYTIFGPTPTVVDVKTTADSSPSQFAKSVAEYRYDMQHVWYCQGVAAILGCHWRDVDFVFVTVPTSEPFLPMAYRLTDERDLANAEADCARAREIWRDCRDANIWPKWARDIHPLQLPPYARKRIEDNINEHYR